MGLARYMQVGAKFVWPLGNQPLQEARDRFTVTGNPAPAMSPWGPCLDFNGATSYLTLGSSWEYPLRFDSGAQDFSVVAWVLHRVSGDFQQIIEKRDGIGDGWALRTLADDTFRFSVNSVLIPSANPLTVGVWHTVGVSVVRVGNGQVYLDGVADGAPVAIGGEVMATTGLPRIGARSFTSATNLWTGCMAGIVILPRALSAEEHAGTHSGGGPF